VSDTGFDHVIVTEILLDGLGFGRRFYDHEPSRHDVIGPLSVAGRSATGVVVNGYTAMGFGFKPSFLGKTDFECWKPL
jgi:hypothetical protein